MTTHDPDVLTRYAWPAYIIVLLQRPLAILDPVAAGLVLLACGLLQVRPESPPRE